MFLHGCFCCLFVCFCAFVCFSVFAFVGLSFAVAFQMDKHVLFMFDKFFWLYCIHVLFFQDSEKYVEQLLDLFNRFSTLVKDAFDDDPRFLTSRDKVSFVN